MSHPHRVVALIGSTSERSRTQALVEAIVAALAARLPVQVETLSLRTLAPHLLPQGAPAPALQQALDTITAADLLIAATPVYKGSYAGLFKHLIDLVPPEALVGRPVLLAATGGSDRHALVVDHQLRPLFAFFRAQSVPSAVYAAEADFDGLAVRSAALQSRIDEAAAQAAQLLVAPRADVLALAA
jgi:FMN reductase